MTETSIEATAEQTPLTITKKVDDALGYDYEQLRLDVTKLAQTASGLSERIRSVPGGNTDARLGALVVAARILGEADFHMRHGDELAHLDVALQDQPTS